MTKKITLQTIDKKLDTILSLLEPKPALDENLIKLEMKDYMTPQYLFDECKKLFKIYSCVDLSRVTSERTGNYTVYFKNNQEADEEYKNISANQLKYIEVITLEERLLMEIEYFKKTGKHLDIENITLCSGSRYSDGYVPYVHFYSGDQAVHVGYWGPGIVHPGLRARRAVKIENV